MSADMSTEKLIAFADVPALAWLPERRSKLCQGTVYRWYAYGIRGIKLEAVSAGGTLCTTESRLMAFFERLVAAPTNIRPPTTKQHEAAQERARATVARHLGRRGSKLVGAGA